MCGLKDFKILALLIVFSTLFYACQNTVPGDRIGSPLNPNDSFDAYAINSFSCNPEEEPSPSKLRRLSKLQYSSVIQDLLRSRLSSANATSVLNFIQNSLNAIPNDSDTDHQFTTQDSSLSELHVEKYFQVAYQLADKVTEAGFAESFIGSCASSPNENCVRGFIRSFGLQVYRRPLIQEDEDFYYSVYQEASGGFRALIGSLLLAPQFLFHLEYSNAIPDSESAFSLNAYELASRLSFFFWGSMPDEQLFEAARLGRLSDPTQYAQEVDRILADPKSKRHMDEFYSEWLLLNKTAEFETGDPSLETFMELQFPENFNTETFRDDMIQEMIHLTNYVTWEKKGSVADLLTSPYSFATSTELAAHVYGVTPWQEADHNNLVSFSDASRSGILTRAQSVFTGTTRTRPIMKGVHILDRILCNPLPIPDDNSVPGEVILEDNFTTREYFSALTQTPGTSCASCHQAINPIGFPFENYDAFGKLRNREIIFHPTGSGQEDEVLTTRPIDSSVSLSLNGRNVSVQNGVELSSSLASSYRVHACFARQYWRYNFGRWEDLNLDACSLQSMYENLKEGDGSIQSMMKAIALHPDFKKKVNDQE